MRTRRPALAALLCASLAHPASASDTFVPEHGVIFPPEKMESVLHPCSRSAPGPVEGGWQPGERDVVALERRLPGLFKTEAKKEAESFGGRMPEASNYYRQYVGLIIGGRHIVYVNAFDSHLAENQPPNPRYHFDWKTTVPFACDFGTGEFGVEYDPAADTFAHFEFDDCMCNKKEP
jgi:hypothetical protein